MYIKSGCVRSFDRRPLVATTSDTVANSRSISNIDLHGVACGSSSSASTSHGNLVKAETEGSYDGLSSEDQIHPSVDETMNEWKTVNNLDTLLESLDWD